MASPYPVVTPGESSTRRIREGIELHDFRQDRPDGKILPKKGEKNILITSALPYVNNQPHLGNIIGSTLSADVFARYCRGKNIRTLYVCGTDEYGTTTEVMAAKEGLSPQALCDKYHKLHADAYEWFDIGFDHFGRTTTPQQTEICQEIFLKLHTNDFLEEQEMTQLYCEKDQRYLADRYVEGTCPNPDCGYEGARGDQCEVCSKINDPLDLINPHCSSCGTAPTTRKTAHFFLKLPELQPEIESFVKERSTEGVWSSNGKAFTNGWLNGGLKTRCITRDLEWGVPLPVKLGEKWAKKVMYVWFDAPIGYPSITANYTPDWAQWWQDPESVNLHQFMGKDNVPFHTVLFPAYLIGTRDNWTLLHSISTTEYLQYEGTKFSKSKNVGVFGSNARETGVPSAVWRYYLLSNRPETNDSEFTWNDFVARNNSELLNNLGNFVNRVIKFVVAKCDGVVPGQDDPTPAPEDEAFLKEINEHIAHYSENMDQHKIRAALQNVMALSGRGNQYLQDNKLDNALLASNPERCHQVLLYALNAIYVLSALLQPFMPSTSESVLRQLNATPRTIPSNFSIDLLPGHKLGAPEYLFKRIDEKNIDSWRQQFGGAGVRVAEDEADKGKKKKGGKGAKKPVAASAGPEVPKTEEQLELEKVITAQGEVVRQIKKGESEGDLKAELDKLLRLKKDMEDLTERLKAVAVNV